MSTSSARQAIIETASDLFYRNGYNLTGINEVIREAGVAKATLYSHFKSKDDLCIAYLQHMHTGFMADIRAFVLAAPEGEEQLLAIFDFLRAFFARDDFNGCWCINTVSEIPQEKVVIIEEIRKQKNELRSFILQVVQQNRSNKPKAVAQVLANQLYLLYEGAVSESYLLKEGWPIDSAKAMGKAII